MRRRGWSGRSLVVLALVAGLLAFWLSPTRPGEGVASPLLTLCAVFGSCGLLLVVIAVVQMFRAERRVSRAREASRGVAFDSTTYPGRTLR